MAQIPPRDALDLTLLERALAAAATPQTWDFLRALSEEELNALEVPLAQRQPRSQAERFLTYAVERLRADRMAHD